MTNETTTKQRAPQVFMLDEEAPQIHNAKVKATTTKPKTKFRKPQVIKTEVIFADEAPLQDLVEVPRTIDRNAPKGFRWLNLLLSSLFFLVTLWAGLAVTTLVESFFARSPFLGWVAFGAAALAALAALVIITREIFGLWRLNKIEALQESAARAINLDEQKAADETLEGLAEIYGKRQDLKWHREKLFSHAADIIDPSDRIKLAERYLLEPLDEEASRIIAKRARRVTLLTTVTPAAALDILFVATQNLIMLREIATLYGGRPSTLTTLKLARMVMTHLAITGGLALSDNLLQHFVGKGLLGRLSARFGEGALNGIMTTRIGLAASEVCRPIPRGEGNRRRLSGLLMELVRFGDKQVEDQPRIEDSTK